ncbi:hypothetical protein EON83_20370 [bacterium]|nr:MAG: hypothetical protein EON83_20370 [bacterium]
MQPVRATPAAELREPARSAKPDFMPEMVITSAEYERRMNDVRQFVREQMILEADYGCIPSTPKPTLFKPGAEKLLAIFGFSTKYETTHRVENFCDKVPFCSYEVKVSVVNKRTGIVEAEGLGACNSRERKYAKQDAANVANTILKMAKKRALIDATLLATRTSSLFSSKDTEETSNSTPTQEPEPRMVLVASRELLERCERARRAAVAAGYRTATDTKPKPVAEGESKRVALAKCEKWEVYARQAAEKLADETGERVPDDSELNTDDTASIPTKKRPRYTIHKGARATNCTSCGKEIYFVKTDKGASVPVTRDGYSHFEDCPNAGHHSSKPTLPKHIKHLWAVASAAGLDTGKTGRDERLMNGNQVLLDHQFDAVGSWNDLKPEAARCLAGAIDAKVLTWGQPVEAGEAA